MNNMQTNNKAREVAEQIVFRLLILTLIDAIIAAIEKAVGEIEQRGEA